MHTLLLSQKQVESLLDVELAVRAAEAAFVAQARSEARVAPQTYVDLPQFEGDFRALPAYADRAAGVKWVSSYTQNPSTNGLPAVMGLLVLSDPATAYPIAVMDATVLTAFRSGAAAALASKHLCHAPPRTLGLVGCGVQARHVLEAHRFVFGDALEVLCADVSRTAADRLAHECRGRAVSLEEAAACDVVCTTTPSRVPLVREAWLAPHAHVNAMGADAPGKQELDPQVLDGARVFVDDVAQAVRGGEINVPVAQGRFEPEQIAGTLAEVIARRVEPLRGSGRSVFDSTGLAIQDVALARAIYDRAIARGIGTEATLVGA